MLGQCFSHYFKIDIKPDKSFFLNRFYDKN
jgi:hypothetical protein